jgi:C-terminal peptidase prc
MKRIRFVLLGVAMGVCLFLGLEKTSARSVSGRSIPVKYMDLLESVISHIRNDYIDEKDPVQTMDGSFKGLVNSLDIGSSYLNAESTTRYLAQKSQPVKEPGIILLKRYGAFPQVIGIIENSPAAKSDLEIGDSIAEINGLGTPTMSLAEANLCLRDLEDKPVILKILRGDKTPEIKLDRTFLFQEPVTYKPREGMGGILKVARLTPTGALEIKAKVLPILKKQKKPVIIDLRNCNEGTYEAAWQFLNLFLTAENAGYFAGRGDARDVTAFLDEPVLAGTPLIVWINQATLGPAEAVAAILQDFGRAKLVGQATPGLAARYEYLPLEDGTSVLLTSGIFCLRSGTKLWGRGVEPDVKVDESSPSLESYLKKTQGLSTTP